MMSVNLNFESLSAWLLLTKALTYDGKRPLVDDRREGMIETLPDDFLIRQTDSKLSIDGKLYLQGNGIVYPFQIKVEMKVVYAVRAFDDLHFLMVKESVDVALPVPEPETT